MKHDRKQGINPLLLSSVIFFPKTMWSSKNVFMYPRNFMEGSLTNLQDLNCNSFAIKCNANQNRQKS